MYKYTSFIMASKGKQLNWIEFNLLRPEVNIGSNINKQESVFCFKDDYIQPVQTLYNEAFNRIFVEIMSNSIDNKWRTDEAVNGGECVNPMKYIKIWVNQQEKSITIQNDGKHIPIEITEYKYLDPSTNKTIVQNIYPAQLFFGEWLSGTNYNDQDVRKTSGKNGIGAKATNIFSKKMIVEQTDPINKKKLVLEYSNNRRDVSAPKITKCVSKIGYTKITFFPDLKKFKMDNISDDWVSIFKKYAYDCAMITGLNVSFNGNKVNGSTLKIYSKLYHNPSSSGYKSVELPLDNIQVIIQSQEVDPDIDFSHISFVNGIYTKDGGVHVDAVKNYILDSIRDKFKEKKFIFTRKELQVFFKIFVKYECDKPQFDSQSKHKLTSPKPKITPQDKQLLEAKVISIMKWPFISVLKDRKTNKEMAKIATQDNKRRSTLNMGDKLDDANWAKIPGKGKHCILCITEGQSAKALVTGGRSSAKNGHNTIGAYALKGKLRNSAKISSVKLNANTEIINLKKVIGLKCNQEYKDQKEIDSLRYGKVAILCDQDEDGHHIGGLILQFFYKEYPYLITNNFIGVINTPIVRVKYNKKLHEFYTHTDFNSFRKGKKNLSVSYYKGLGSHTKLEQKDIFKNLRIVNVTSDGSEEEKNAMRLGFEGGQKYADDRKNWLLNYDPDVEKIIDESIKNGYLPMKEFINGKLILFSNEDTQRSIPSILDGLKPSQRKILYTLFKRKIDSSSKKVKVSQLAGTVTEEADYHHGEASLHGAIIGMAQNFVGSNNINLLYPSGSFGTRLGKVDSTLVKGEKKFSVKGGADASAPRYLFTFLNKIAYSLFDQRDEELYEYNKSDEGDDIEPKFYLPILPMALVNGCSGIGTGWSTTINCYNPLELVDWIKAWIVEKEDKLKPLYPWYRNWTGSFKVTSTGITTEGIIKELTSPKAVPGKCKKNDIIYNVTELPVGMCTNTFKIYLEKLEAEGKMIVDEFNDEKVNFILYPKKDYNPTKDSEFMKKLTKNLCNTNMVGLDISSKPVKYDTVEEILLDYCEIRLDFYEKRKINIIKNLIKELMIHNNKYKFIDFVINKQKITIFNKSNSQLSKDLETHNFDKINNSYTYLTSMPFNMCTTDNLEKLKSKIKNIESDLKFYKNTDGGEMWNKDLDNFVSVYTEFLKIE